jgi:transposase
LKAEFCFKREEFVIERIGVKSVFSNNGLEKAMAKYKPYDYGQGMMIPVSLEEQLVPGTLEFAIQTLVEDRMDMAVFEDRYENDETGRWAYDPKILLKVVLLGYARGLISSRKMEQACRENVTFMALTCGEQPDHSTIAAFVSSMKEEIKPMFRDVLMVCEEEGLLGGTFFALDGCKLPSNASKEWSGTIRDLRRKREKLEEKLSDISSFVKIYLGLDPARAHPVTTCHYMMGGIPTTVDGRVLSDEKGSIVQGLYAAGECACVSVHGANRLGCNSLLDLLVFGRRSGFGNEAGHFKSGTRESLKRTHCESRKRRSKNIRRRTTKQILGD